MSEYLSSEAVVLKSQDYKEDDKIITIFGEKTGKLRAVVKGVKKSNSKLRGAVQGFSVTDLTFTKGKVMPIVIAGEVVKSFNGAADDYTKVNYACILSEFVDKAMPEGEINETIYELLKRGIRIISENNPWSGCMGILLRIIDHLGYAAEYQACVFCGRDLAAEENVYYHADGLVCAECAQASGEMCSELSRESGSVLRALQSISTEQLGQVYASTRAQVQIEHYIELQLGNILDYPLKSWEIHKNFAKTS